MRVEGRRKKLLFSIAADLYDNIFGRPVANISYKMRGAECDVDDAAGACALRLAVVIELKRALLDDDEFGMLDGVRAQGAMVPAGCMDSCAPTDSPVARAPLKTTRPSVPFGWVRDCIWL